MYVYIYIDTYVYTDVYTYMWYVYTKAMHITYFCRLGSLKPYQGTEDRFFGGSILGLYRDNGKENGNYYNELYRV